MFLCELQSDKQIVVIRLVYIKWLSTHAVVHESAFWTCLVKETQDKKT